MCHLLQKNTQALGKGSGKNIRGVELFNNRRQPGCNLREEAQNEDFQGHGKAKGNNTLDDVGHGAIRADALQNKQVHAYGRSNQCQLQIEQHNYIELNGVKANTANERENNRQSDKNNGNGFQNSTQEQKQNIDGNENKPFIIGNANHGLGQSLGSL